MYEFVHTHTTHTHIYIYIYIYIYACGHIHVHIYACKHIYECVRVYTCIYIYCVCIYIYIYIYHHVVPLARISQAPSRHFSLSFIASGRSSGLHPVSSHSCCVYVRAGRPAFARPYVGVHRSISLRNSYLLLQQCSACLVRLSWIVFVMGGWWPYSWCLVGCCRQDLFNIARNILV